MIRYVAPPWNLPPCLIAGARGRGTSILVILDNTHTPQGGKKTYMRQVSATRMFNYFVSVNHSSYDYLPYTQSLQRNVKSTQRMGDLWIN